MLTQFRTEHAGFGMVTGAVETGGRLWLGSIGWPAIAHLPWAG